MTKMEKEGNISSTYPLTYPRIFLILPTKYSVTTANETLASALKY